jgi:hypothetical protein
MHDLLMPSVFANTFFSNPHLICSPDTRGSHMNLRSSRPHILSLFAYSHFAMV